MALRPGHHQAKPRDRRIGAVERADDAALIHHRDAVAEHEQFFEILANDDDAAALGPHVEEFFVDETSGPMSRPRVGCETISTFGSKASSRAQQRLLQIAAGQRRRGSSARDT